MAKDPVKYWKAEDVQDIADELIKQFHPHLAGESIIYLFRSEHSEESGKMVFGKARRVTGLNAYLAVRADLEDMNGPADDPDDKAEAPPLKLIEIAFDVWKELNATQRIALVDHELCHFGADGMRPHDVEEFRAVIDRHGLWRPEIELLAATIAQQKLFPAGPSGGGTSTESIAETLMDQLNDPSSAASRLMKPKEGSVTISSGRRSVTFTADPPT